MLLSKSPGQCYLLRQPELTGTRGTHASVGEGRKLGDTEGQSLLVWVVGSFEKQGGFPLTCFLPLTLPLTQEGGAGGGGQTVMSVFCLHHSKCSFGASVSSVVNQVTIVIL